jgi:hypothetical protein
MVLSTCDSEALIDIMGDNRFYVAAGVAAIGIYCWFVIFSAYVIIERDDEEEELEPTVTVKV